MKPLSETHPTLWKVISYSGMGELTWTDTLKVNELIQEYSVDVAEHERLTKQFMDTAEKCYHAQREVERLKKEVANARVPWIRVYEAGVVEGERRAIERIRRRCEDCCLLIGGVCEKHTDWELGLGENKEVRS